MTDYVVAWWVVCAAAEVSETLTSTARVEHFAYMSLAAGLALLAKPTGAVFLAPFALLALWRLVRDVRPRQALLVGAVGVAAIVIINAGHMSRNVRVFGGLFVPPVR
jgi:4-amino-4-deoxy-L-arabinose transferase-like glycosyltransferase